MSCPIIKRIVNFNQQPGVAYKLEYWNLLSQPPEHSKFKEEKLQIIEDAKAYDANPDNFTALNNTYLRMLRDLVLKDIFFQLHFIHQPFPEDLFNDSKGFVVNMCKQIETDAELHERGECNDFEDLWARGHFKSTSITVAQNIQRRLQKPGTASIIFSHTKKMAEEFLSSIKGVLELPIMYKLFPDRLWKNLSDAPSWSKRDGLTLNSPVLSRKDKTFQTSGLIEGMQTGGHYDDLFYDDVETDDIADSPQQLYKLIKKFDMSRNMRMVGDDVTSFVRVIGTPYHYQGMLMHIKEKVVKKDGIDTPIYRFRRVPAIDENGKSVLLSEKELDILRTSEHFNSQQLCDPSPEKGAAFRSHHLIEVDEVPKGLFKFVVVDPAGDKADGDDVGLLCLGVEPNVDELGASNIYILDMVLRPMTDVETVRAIIDVYTRNGIVRALGIETMGHGMTITHVAHVLKEQHNIDLTHEDGTLIKLHPQRRGNKITHIRSTLSWPFRNGKIHIKRSIPYTFREKFKREMDEFPATHPNGLDALAYYPIMLAEMNFESEIIDDSKVVSLLSYKGDSMAASGCSWMSG
jgi:hypothetical protein